MPFRRSSCPWEKKLGEGMGWRNLKKKDFKVRMKKQE
jgi:hypothetical protein